MKEAPILKPRTALRQAPDPANSASWRLPVLAILAVWLFHYVSMVLPGLIAARPVNIDPLLRLVPITFGVILSLGMKILIDRIWHFADWIKIGVIIAVSWLIPIPYGLLNMLVFGNLNPDIPLLQKITGMWLGFSHLFFAIAVTLLAVKFAVAMREQQVRSESIMRLAQQSELQALRYQVNPHFLFNALNSIASLLRTERAESAEEMIEDLADYYRSVLSESEEGVAHLDEEVKTQLNYLSIERVRFPDRLFIVVDLPQDLKKALVPRLILQPLIENAIKHSAALTPGKVTLAIRASRKSDHLLVEVKDTRSDRLVSYRKARSHGTGLDNVQRRLAALYDGMASLQTEMCENGFRVVLRMPLQFAA